MARFIAFYLPQFHPTPENNEWWGPGFTEWTCVAQAKPLFKGHKQPKIPADLGFYDLRVPETREEQAKLAKDAGIEGFCYWHYWFGNGKRLLERPFREVVESGSPNFQFCLAWANHSWYKKLWSSTNRSGDKLLIEQTYPGTQDYINHFHSLLSAFKDKRYIRVNGKLLFFIYDVINFEDIKNFITTWRDLAKKNDLNDFYFVGTDYDGRYEKQILDLGLDATYNDNRLSIHHHKNKIQKLIYLFQRKILKKPTCFKYKEAIRYMIPNNCIEQKVIPCITPNWDHSPRSGANAMILTDCKPKYFKKVVEMALEKVKDKPVEEQIILIKSWNEWGEGNYMEPDSQYGHGYLNVLNEAIKESK